MKAKRIRYQDGSKVEQGVLHLVCETIVRRAARVGFIVDAEMEDDSTIDIGLHMRSFRIDVNKIGHNAKLNGQYGHKSPKGYIRTDVPTWDQRVEFNNLVNAVFDSHKLIASIISGNYTVRKPHMGGAVRSWPEGGDRASGGGWSGDCTSWILPESEARRQCNSDALEAKHKIDTRAIRREYQQQRADMIRELKKAPFIAFYVKERYDSEPELEVMTFAQFEKFNSKRERRHKIKLKSLRPAYGETLESAKNLLQVMDRLKIGGK